ncbi:hypothetical protein IHE49_15355 [Rhodanobacter sp. 7MK24]|uniref:hypothetical protein n=1 Tax=Rhodanobacter sp. 7MK24 TaxID=2775922 RepID=UPI0017806666|nr:hypothetical protein [Rhodanobacter sp. 7MK24]MBD8881863.1 hypothetical protein [Rhodanobacter sp. 7MK24]
MSLQLLLDDEWTILIPTSDYIHEAWGVQHVRASNAGRTFDLSHRLAESFAACLVECLDPDLKPPTQAQIVYATDIARTLGVPLPLEALRYRGDMAAFIEGHVEEFNAGRRKK